MRILPPLTDPDVTEDAPAKINLALHVTGRRGDGYHLLDSLVCFTAFGDTVRISRGPAGLEVDGPFAHTLIRDDENNLCLRAARLAGASVSLRLTKHVPVSSGIGGGSADAAAVLRGLARMGMVLPDNLCQLGADVPVCMSPLPAHMRGIGDRIIRLPALPPLHLVLVNPGVPLSTPQVFAALDRRDNAPLTPIPAFADAADLTGWLRATRNDLEAPAIEIVPAISQVLAALNANGSVFSRMSGSGATCFGIFPSRDKAVHAVGILQRQGWWSVQTGLVQTPARV